MTQTSLFAVLTILALTAVPPGAEAAMNGEALNGEALNAMNSGELSGVTNPDPQSDNRRIQAPTAMRPIGLSFPNGTKIVFHY